jgi:hypothetical protein
VRYMHRNAENQALREESIPAHNNTSQPSRSPVFNGGIGE